MESTFRQGIIYSLTAYLLWGILPIYWKTLGVVQAFEILSNRFIWSCVFVWILIIASGRVKSFLAETQDIFTNPKQALAMLAAAITISFNWGLFIWAVNDGRIVETSMGYYINPLVSIVFGVFFLKERLDNWQMAAVICAVIGVGYNGLEPGPAALGFCIISCFFCFIRLDQEMFIGNDNDEYYAGNTAYNAAGFGL